MNSHRILPTIISSSHQNARLQSTLTIPDLIKLKQFLQNPDTLMVNSPEDNINADTDPTTPAQTKTHSNKIDSFEYSGKNFIDLINENFNQEQIDLNNNFIASPSKDFENLYINKDTNDKQNETEKFIASRDIDIKDYKRFEKLLHILNKGNDLELFNYLMRYKNVIESKFLKNLNSFEISTIIKRLVNFQLKILEFNKFEKLNSSKILKDTNYDSNFEVVKKSYSNILSLIKIIKNSNKKLYKFNLNDYENLINLQFKNNKFKSTIRTILELETIVESKNNYQDLKLNNFIWNIKLKLLGDANIVNWKFDRYKLYTTKIDKISENYKYKNGENISGENLLNQYSKSNLIPNNEIHSSFILSFGKQKNLNLLDNYILKIFGISENSFNYFEMLKEDKDIILFNRLNNPPNLNLLISILYSYSINYNLLKSFKIINLFLKNYKITNNYNENLSKFFNHLFKMTGLTLKNIHKNYLESIFKLNKFQNDEFYSNFKNFKLTDEIIDLIWIKILNNYSNNYYLIPNNLFKLKIKYSSTESLLSELPIIYNKLIINNNTNKQNKNNHFNYSINENLYISYINKCRIGLQKNLKFYEAELLINNYSINDEMKEILLNNLNKNQTKYLNRLREDDKEKRKQNLINDDEDNMLGLW